MYSSRGSNVYGQEQPYSSQSSYAPQNMGASALLGGGLQETELGGYRNHGRPTAASAAVSMPPPQHYGGEYSSVYGSATQQISPLGMKGSVTTAFEGRGNYGSSMPESPKFAANDYAASSSRGYGQKVDQSYSDRASEYPSVERRQYSDRHSAYLGRDLPSEAANRYAESVAFGNEHQSKLYDHLEQSTVRRQEEMLNARALQSASVEGGARQADYLATRATVRHPAQDPIAYGGRLDPELRSLSMLSGPSYIGKHTASILGAAPQRNLDDLIYAQSSSHPGYGVSLPPGRDYGVGKGLHGTSLELDYPTSILGRHLLVDDRKDDRATYGQELELRDKDRDYLREREKYREREKDRLRERERERERDRERQREREREREREKERERERERREKDRDREQKRRLELKRELTPPRVSKDRRASSLAKDIRSLQRESPRHEVLHRLHSPVKEKRREYACKVFSFSFIEAERDFLSLDKRYPRLYVSPECSKVAVYWPRKNLRLSLYTPVSFEHDFVEDAAVERRVSPSTQPATEVSGAGGQTTVWNAKIILMSGLGQNAQAELSSERTYNDRIPHFCNMLRFAILKKNNSLMAIGGPWDTVDGADPSVDDSSLKRTAMRHAKDVANLDLSNCRHWNRFLEIHYDRVGKDGLFSHKEVTVLYVPDLSDCLPSQDSWREQWFNHKKAVSERDRLRSLTKEVHGDKKESPKDKKKPEHPKDSKEKIEPQKKKEALSSGQSGDDSKKENDASKLKGKETLISEEGKEEDNTVGNKDVGSQEEEKNVIEKVSDTQTPVGVKTGKKKIIKRIVKRKVPKKKDVTEDATEQNDQLQKESVEGNNTISEVDVQQDGSSSNPSAPSPVVKTFVRKRIVKKSASALKKDESSNPEVKAPESAEDKEKVKSEDSNAVIQEGRTKTTVKKKVIKRVPKRKVPPADKVAEDDLKGEKLIATEDIKGEQKEEAAEKQMNAVSSKSSSSSKMKPDEEEVKEDKKEVSGSAMEIDIANQKVSQDDNHAKSKEGKELKDEKERKDHVENESKRRTDKTAKEKKRGDEPQTVKDKKRSDEPPKHPGLILQTKGSKASKLQSLSLSLDSLLDYSDKDIEESTFEKLRIKFVTERNKGKRQREETSQKENEESSSKKRSKTANTNEDVKSSKTENKSGNISEDKKSTKTENKLGDTSEVEKSTKTDDARQGDINTIKEETKSIEQVDTTKIEDEIEEDPEEDPEEDEQMPDASPHHDSIKEENVDAKKNAGDSVGQDVAPTNQQEAAKPTSETTSSLDPSNNNKSIEVDPSNKDKSSKAEPSNKDNSSKVESKPKEASVRVNKELLQAFRFFDRNRAGYIRVEDLRLIIHNLGKYLSHRDVKELVQSALLESNTGRDDRILYDKLVKMSDIQS